MSCGTHCLNDGGELVIHVTLTLPVPAVIPCIKMVKASMKNFTSQDSDVRICNLVESFKQRTSCSALKMSEIEGSAVVHAKLKQT